MGLADITPASFDLISRLALIPAGVRVANDSPVASVDDLVEAIRAGGQTSAGSGLGGPWHMAAAGLSRAAGLGVDAIRFIPSQGGAPALQDLVAGGISLFTDSPVEAMALADAGELRIVAVMSEERSPAFPDVPILKESGLDWALENWFPLCAPRGLPNEVKARAEEAAAAAHAAPAVQQALADRGITPLFDGSEAFAAFAAFAEGFAVEADTLLREPGLAR